MACVVCHTVFDWTTGAVDRGHVHNPHAIQRLRQKGMLGRDVADLPCGGRPFLRELMQCQVLRHNALWLSRIFVFYQLVVLLEDELEQRASVSTRAQRQRTRLRVNLGLGELSKRCTLPTALHHRCTSVKQYKAERTRIDRRVLKNDDVSAVLKMLVDTIGDWLRQTVLTNHVVPLLKNMAGLVSTFWDAT